MRRLRRWLREPRRGYRLSVSGPARSSPAAQPVPRPAELDHFIGKWVAVKDGQVIAVAETSRGLVYEVHKLGSSAKGAVAQYVPPPKAGYMVGVG